MKSFCVAAAVVVLAALPVQAQGVMPAPGDEVPGIRGFDKDDVLHDVDYAKADYTLVNFWAPWCQPCKNEMPMLQAAHEQYGPQPLQIVGVTSERMANADLAEFVESMGLTYPVFRIGEESKPSWPGVRGTLPNSVLVGKDGRLLRRYVGASAEQIEAMKGDLDAVIAGRPLGTMVGMTQEGTSRGTPDKAPKN